MSRCHGCFTNCVWRGVGLELKHVSVAALRRGAAASRASDLGRGDGRQHAWSIQSCCLDARIEGGDSCRDIDCLRRHSAVVYAPCSCSMSTSSQHDTVAVRVRKARTVAGRMKIAASLVRAIVVARLCLACIVLFGPFFVSRERLLLRSCQRYAVARTYRGLVRPWDCVCRRCRCRDCETGQSGTRADA